MFFWFIYIFSTIFISYVLSAFFLQKFRTVILFLFLALLLTPQNMGIETKPSPVLFSFLFELIFEQNVSVRILRPLVFTMPIALILSISVIGFRKKFFQN